MTCLICKCNFSSKKNIGTFLKLDKSLICDKCYHSYPLKINYSVIPLNKHLLYIYSLYPKPYFINSLAYSYEFSKLFSCIYFSFSNNDYCFAFDYFKLTQLKLDIFDDLSSFYDKDIYIICNYMAD